MPKKRPVYKPKLPPEYYDPQVFIYNGESKINSANAPKQPACAAKKPPAFNARAVKYSGDNSKYVFDEANKKFGPPPQKPKK